LPACSPACQSACPCACLPAHRHTGIGTVKCQRAKKETIGKQWQKCVKKSTRRHCPKEFYLFETNSPTNRQAFFLAGWQALLPASLFTCLPARRHTGIGMLGMLGMFKSGHRSKRKGNGDKVGQRTPQAATTTPNAATQRQRDTTFEKVPFLCRRDGRHACLLTDRHPCQPARLPALVPACRHTSIQAKVWWKCKRAEPVPMGKR